MEVVKACILGKAFKKALEESIHFARPRSTGGYRPLASEALLRDNENCYIV